jgi:5-hydroxyisourate hydrolase
VPDAAGQPPTNGQSASSNAQPTISTHVLDTERGAPAAGIRVTLYRLDVGAAPIRMTQALTDDDGRVRDLLGRPLTPGDYRLEFDVARRGDDAAGGGFFTRMSVDLSIADTSRSYHVPLLLAPFAMTTYRGS